MENDNLIEMLVSLDETLERLEEGCKKRAHDINNTRALVRAAIFKIDHGKEVSEESYAKIVQRIEAIN